MDFILLLAGFILLIKCADIFVDGCSNIAKLLKIPTLIIGLTIVAIGTSLPELVTSIVAVKKGETDIAIGNVVGSNIFNIFFVLGVSSVISPITFSIKSFIDVVVMAIASIGVYIMLIKNKRIDKKRSLILLAIYTIYMIYIVIR